MKTGALIAGPAMLHVGISEAIPAHLREKIREISAIYVEPSQRQQGHATGLLLKVCSDADLAGVTLMLCVEPSDNKGLSHEQLAHWYHSFGFREIQPEPLLMARPPQKPIIQLLH